MELIDVGITRVADETTEKDISLQVMLILNRVKASFITPARRCWSYDHRHVNENTLLAREMKWL
jgi:hypothetical protein